MFKLVIIIKDVVGCFSAFRTPIEKILPTCAAVILVHSFFHVRHNVCTYRNNTFLLTHALRK